MSELVDIVSALEHNVKDLIHRLETLKEANTKLKLELQSLSDAYKVNQNALIEWEQKYKSLKMATSMLGGNSDKTEAKLKINALIRDLDYCIAQLAE